MGDIAKSAYRMVRLSHPAYGIAEHDGGMTIHLTDLTLSISQLLPVQVQTSMDH
jgi:hypothetical protein